MSLLADVADLLDSRGVPFALVGAEALALRGASRATIDLDLLTTERSVLSSAFWLDLGHRGIEAEVRIGDANDPLAGVVRVRTAGDRPLDIVVGRSAWQTHLIARADVLQLDGRTIPVARAADLVLLKLYAGGPQDAWDIAQLLGENPAADLVSEVEERLAELPADARELWRTLRR